MANRKKIINDRPFQQFCRKTGKVLNEEMRARGLSAINAAVMLDKDFGLSKQTTYTRVLQMEQLHESGNDPNITIKNLCAVLDAFDLELTVQKKKKGCD